MRTRSLFGGLLVIFMALLVGCPPGVVTPPPEAVLAGKWRFETALGQEFNVFFNDNGVVTRIEGKTAVGDDATLTINNATTDLNGTDVTIVIPTAMGNVTYDATLSTDDNTLSGTLDREINVSGDLQLIISAGDLTLERDDGDDVTEFRATLAGANEVPPVTSATTGEARFEVTANGIEYTLTVNNGVGITAGHIHLGSPTVNGEIVVFLFGPDADGMDINGTLATGIITAEDLINSLDGDDLDALIAELIVGNAYVNVHSLAHPSGEARGQIGAQ